MSIEEKKVLEIQYNNQGLVPAIAQDVDSKKILMLAWMNELALEKTLQTGEAHYWSRSRQELWHKGATSGEIQIVEDIKIDCDQDAILLLVKLKVQKQENLDLRVLRK